MADQPTSAPGWPGLPPTWTSSAKTGVGTALGLLSDVWFTLSHGILDEIYYPRVDRACTRDFGLIVTDRQEFFSEEKRDAQSLVQYLAPGVPAYLLVNTCKLGRYRISKTVLADPNRPVVLQRIRFKPLKGKLDDYALFGLLAPHLNNHGSGNTAWIGDYKGVPMLFARREGTALALACSSPWTKRSAGFAGASDGWQDLMKHKQLVWTYDQAENGNVALTGEVDLVATGGEFVFALGFGRNHEEAGHRARASLLAGFENVRDEYVRQWTEWQQSLLSLPGALRHTQDLYRISTAVMRTHEAIQFPGGAIASLSIPWGFAKGDDNLGGYHLVWPRDLAETAGGLLAAKALADARRVLFYLQVTQEADGHWPQNMWLDGSPYWNGVQMDESAFAILLVDLAHREGALEVEDSGRLWPMVRSAAGYLVCNGPVTQQDRWEEDAGYSPFTLAVEIAALLVAADLAVKNHEPALAVYLRDTADAWNAAIERWIYVTGTDLAKRVGVEGYYIRLAPPDQAEASSPAQGFVPIKNRPPDQSMAPAAHIVSPDALALVRFGLRAADDPRIVNTVRVIDALLRLDTPAGPAWYRYNQDGYGEQADGSPFDVTGIGRAWPLLTGERAHFELAAGRKKEAERLLQALESFANDSGLLPEQIWDSADIPERELFFGKPTGSAMPLVWAHAEYVKLRRSLHDGQVFDMPPQTVKRYLEDKIGSNLVLWRFNQKCTVFPVGSILRVETLGPARVRWSTDNWQTSNAATAKDSGLGTFFADLPTLHLPAAAAVVFEVFWIQDQRWEGQVYKVTAATAL